MLRRRTEGPRGGRRRKDAGAELCFPGSASLLPATRGRGFLTSFVLAPPRPSPRFGSWLVLPGLSGVSEYVCDGPRASHGRETLARLACYPLGCGSSASRRASLRAPSPTLLVSGCWSWFPSRALPHAAGLTGWGVGVSLSLHGLRPSYKKA